MMKRRPIRQAVHSAVLPAMTKTRDVGWASACGNPSIGHARTGADNESHSAGIAFAHTQSSLRRPNNLVLILITYIISTIHTRIGIGMSNATKMSIPPADRRPVRPEETDNQNAGQPT